MTEQLQTVKKYAETVFIGKPVNEDPEKPVLPSH